MGCFGSKQKLIVATLNYSGNELSPFQFYSEELHSEENEISICFKKNVEALVNKKNGSKDFRCNTGKIGEKMQVDRYSPIFRKGIGIQSGKLVNYTRFQILWKEEFEKNINKYDLTYSAEEKDHLLKFDLCCYTTLLQIAYKKEQIDFQTCGVQPYEKLIKTFFDKDFLNQRMKIERIFSSIDNQNIDVCFFQKVSKEFISLVNPLKFFSVTEEKGDSMILVRRKKFKRIQQASEVFSEQTPQILHHLNWNKNKSICFADQSILVCWYLPQQKDENHQQAAKMMKSLQLLKQYYPTHQILIGFNSSTYCSSEKMKPFHVYPNLPTISTTKKKRTWVQTKTEKVEQAEFGCQDFLASTQELKQAKVVTIDNIKAEEVNLLPCDRHPFSHFAVIAYLQLE